MWSFSCTLTDLTIQTPWFIIAIFSDAPSPTACKLISGYFLGFILEEHICGGYDLRWKYVSERVWKTVTLYDVRRGKCDWLGNPIR